MARDPIRKGYRAPRKYTAKKGESLSKISNKFKLKNYDVARANPNIYRVSAGQTINIPRINATAKATVTPAKKEEKSFTPATRGGRGAPRRPTINFSEWLARLLAPTTTAYSPATRGGRGAPPTLNTGLSPMQVANRLFPTGQFQPATRGGRGPYNTALLGESNLTTGGYRDVGAGGRVTPYNQAAALAAAAAARAAQAARIGYGGRMLAEGVEGRPGSPNMLPLFQTWADYVIVPDYPDLGTEEGYGDYGGGYGGYGRDGGGGGGGGGGYDYNYPGYGREPSTSGPSFAYSPAGYQYGNFNYGTLGLVNWRI